MKNSVCAIIVTYNRLDLLKRCIQAVSQQTILADILVINNGSTDGTLDWLNQQSGITIITQKNLGGSGGFNRGCMHVVENGYEFAWLMDDDGYPSESALKELINTPNFGLAVKNSLVIDTHDHVKLSFTLSNNGKTVTSLGQLTDDKMDYVLGCINPFNGTLIPSKLFDMIGLPYGDMFIWGDESEYTQRIMAFGIPVITVVSSIFYHPIAKEITDVDWDNTVAWRKFFSTRNLYRVLGAKSKKYILIRYTKSFVSILIDSMLSQKTKRASKFRMLMNAYVDAIFGRFGTVPNELACLRSFIKK